MKNRITALSRSILASSFFILLIITFLEHSLYSQEIFFEDKLEISGSFFYNFISDEGPVDISQPGENYVYTKNKISIYPSIGYFIISNVEVIFEPKYTITKEKLSGAIDIAPLPSFPGIAATLYEPAVAVGIYYQVPVLERIVPFCGLRVGVSWTKTKIEDDPGGLQNVFPARWSKPEVLFPGAAAGIKFFASHHWGVVAQVQYAKTKHRNGYDDRSGENFETGLGFLVLL